MMSSFTIALCFLLFARLYSVFFRNLSNNPRFLQFTIFYTLGTLTIVLLAMKYFSKPATIGDKIVSCLIILVSLMSIGGRYFSLKKRTSPDNQ